MRQRPHPDPRPARPPAVGLALALTMLLGVAPALAASPAPGARSEALEAARRFLCPHGGAPVRGQGGRCRRGRDPSVRGWDAGLPPAARAQAPCPDGTHPAAALACPEATRCVPD
jgi:hypothetical protein